MVKVIASYQLFRYKTLELVVDSKLIANSDCYDPCPISIPRSSNLILAEEIIHSRADEDAVRRTEEISHSRDQEQPSTRVRIHDGNEEEEKRHMDVNDDHMGVVDDDE
jgi:hypothetical protein